MNTVRVRWPRAKTRGVRRLVVTESPLVITGVAELWGRRNAHERLKGGQGSLAVDDGLGFRTRKVTAYEICVRPDGGLFALLTIAD